MVADVQVLAAFDVDNTLVSGQTQALLVEYLAERGMLPASTLSAVAAWFAAYRMGLPVRHERIRRLVLRSLAGLSADEIENLAENLVQARIRPRVRGAALQRVQELADSGVTCVLVSASAEPIVRHLAYICGVPHVVATRLQLASGVLTGFVDGRVVEGEHKLRALLDWANDRFDAWHLAEAYGDHASDAVLLSAARTAYAVNPTPALRRLALQKGWSCLDWSDVEGEL